MTTKTNSTALVPMTATMIGGINQGFMDAIQGAQETVGVAISHFHPSNDFEKVFAVAAPIPYLAARGATGAIELGKYATKRVAHAVFG